MITRTEANRVAEERIEEMIDQKIRKAAEAGLYEVDVQPLPAWLCESLERNGFDVRRVEIDADTAARLEGRQSTRPQIERDRISW